MTRKALTSALTTTSIAAAALAALAGAVSAAEVTKVQLGFTNSGSNLCPRIVTMKAWAHTEGPAVVKFVIRNNSGGKSGEMPVAAVKGPAGNWIATLTQKITITTDVDTKYMAEVKGWPKISNWVPLKEKCLGKAPKTVSGGKGPPVKHVSEVNKPANDPKPTGNSKPANNGKPTTKPANNSKPTSKPIQPACLDQKLTATRLSAVTKKGGIGTAWTAWELAAKKKFGSAYASSHHAKSRKETCTWAGMYNCTVSAFPCRS